MDNPKFKSGQMVKYVMYGETRYNNVAGVVWHPSLACYMYKLEEPLAMPIYREDSLELVSDEEKEELYRACKNGLLILDRKGYLTVRRYK